MIRRILTILFLFLTVSFTLPARNEKLPVRKITPSTVAFQEGESLVYTCHYQWGPINSDVAKGYLTVGTASVNGQDTYVCRVYGKTAKFYDPFFKVREDFRCWLSTEDLTPLRYTRETKEGGYFAKDEYRYVYQPEAKIEATLNSKTKGARVMDLPVKGATYDFVSLLYIARNVDLSQMKKGEKYYISFALGGKVSDIHYVCYGPEVKNIKGIGKVNTIKFGLQLVAGEQFNGDADMYMWLSDDDNRIPLCFEAPIKLGLVTGRLESFDGLKHPFSSIIQ